MKQGHTIYLDFAASSPVSQTGRQAFLKALPLFGNPSSAHEEGRRAKALLEEARTRVAREALVKSDSVIFTSGATEANALLIEGRIDMLRREGRSTTDMHILYSSGSHASVIEMVQKQAERGIRCDVLPLLNGGINLQQFETLLREDTVLVLVDLVESETGAMTDTRSLRRMLDARYTNASVDLRPLLHVDASQAPLVESIALPHILSHTLSLDAQKIGGVRGVGALLCPRNITLSPLLLGGGQERGLRSGTEAVALIASFSEALVEAGEKRDAFVKRAQVFRTQLIARLTKASNKVVVIEGEKNAPHIVTIAISGCDTDYLQALLGSDGFSVATRSACETNEPYSRAVLSRTGDRKLASSTLRISWGHQTKERELSAFAKAFARLLSFLEANAL
jgi:cysteine desulfurase